MKAYYNSHIEGERVRSKQRAADGEWKTPKHKERIRAYYVKNRERVTAREREARLKRRYGITVKQRDQMFAQYEGKCWLCREGVAEMIDHCHKTGRVRGALCLHCNNGLGFFRDNTGTLLKAIRYLTQGKDG
jgi:hypothetical protein